MKAFSISDEDFWRVFQIQSRGIGDVESVQES
jgi:hypothetical protein